MPSADIKSEHQNIDELVEQLSVLYSIKSNGSGNLRERDMLNKQIITLHYEQDPHSINTKIINDWTMLADSAAKGYVESIRLLLSLKADPNKCIPPYNQSPLQLAAIVCSECVTLLLEHGANINHVDNQGQTATYLACASNSIDSLAILLRYKPNLSYIKTRGYSYLNLALSLKSPESLNLLLENGVSVPSSTLFNLFDDTSGNRIPGSDIFNMKTLNLLYKYNPSIIHATSDQGKTPLMHAACNSNVTMAIWLLSKGCDVNARDERKRTPLIYAAAGASINCLRVLANQGADLNCFTVSGATASFEAVRSKSLECVRFLFEQGADFTKYYQGISASQFSQQLNDRSWIFLKSQGLKKTLSPIIYMYNNEEELSNRGRVLEMKNPAKTDNSDATTFKNGVPCYKIHKLS